MLLSSRVNLLIIIISAVAVTIFFVASPFDALIRIIGFSAMTSPHKKKIGSVDLKLSFEIDSEKGQAGIRKHGYYFTKDGKCRSIKGDSPVSRFTSQQTYEAFGSDVEEYIFYLLESQFKLRRINIKSGGSIMNSDDKSKRFVLSILAH